MVNGDIGVLLQKIMYEDMESRYRYERDAGMWEGGNVERDKNGKKKTGRRIRNEIQQECRKVITE